MVPMFLTVLGCSGSIGGPASPASGYLVEVEGLAPGRHVPADVDNVSDQTPASTTDEKGE